VGGVPKRLSKGGTRGGKNLLSGGEHLLRTQKLFTKAVDKKPRNAVRNGFWWEEAGHPRSEHPNYPSGSRRQ